MASLGDLVVNLSMDSRGFTKGTQVARRETSRLAQTIQQQVTPAALKYEMAQQRITELHRLGMLTSSQYKQALSLLGNEQNRFSQGSLKMQGNMTQLAFAVEDASVSFGTGGLAGAIRGASNNLTLIASNMGGAKGAMAAVAIVASVQLIPTLLKMTGLIEDQQQALANYRKQLEATAERLRSLSSMAVRWVRHLQDMRDVGQADTSREAQGVADRAADDLDEIGAKLQANAKAQWEHTQALEIWVGKEEQYKMIQDEIHKLRLEEISLIGEQARQQDLLNKASERAAELAKEEEAAEQALLEQEYERNRQAAHQKARAEAKAASEKAAREEEEARRKEIMDRKSAEQIERGIIDDIDPNEKRSQERDIHRELMDRMRQIDALSVSAEEKAHLTRGAKIAAATKLAGLEGGSGGPTGPVEGMVKGSKEALQAVLQTQMKNKEEPKESTQLKIEKHLQAIETRIKNNPNAFTAGAFQ